MIHTSSLNITRSKQLTHALLWFVVATCTLIISSEIRIPLPWTPVPITLQTFSVILIALCMSPRVAVSSCVTYVMLGAIGVPIFAGWTSGILRPTSGYILGFILATVVLSSLRERIMRLGTMRSIALTYLCGDVVICAVGLIWLKIWTHADWSTVVMAGYIPFIPGGILKTSAACLAARRFNRA